MALSVPKLRRWIEALGRHLRWVGGISTALAMAFASLYWLASDGWMVRSSYDNSHRLYVPLHASAGTHDPVILVYLDLESYRQEKQNPTQPWSRALHAQLVRRLTRAGARRVVFDILFSDAGSTPTDDAALRDAIADNGQTILSGEIIESSQFRGDVTPVQMEKVAGPWEDFERAASGWGLAELGDDGDFIVRRFFPGTLEQAQGSTNLDIHPAISIAAVAPTNLAAFMAIKRWVRYYGPPLVVPHVSYSSALRPDEVPDEVFRDRIVVIGARPMPGGFDERRDELRNPLSEWGRRDQFMPAVEMHATQILNLLNDDWIRRLPLPWETFILLTTTATLSGLLFWLRPLPATGGAIAAEILVLAGAGWAFEGQSLWFPWMIIAAGQIPGILVSSIVVQSWEWYRQKQRFEADRRRAEAKIREQAALLDKAQDAILVRTLDGTLLYANPSAERLYGLDAVQLIKSDAWARLASLDATKIAEAEAAVLASGEWSGELPQQDVQNRPLIVESRWTLIRDDQGRPVSILQINTDVTEKKRIEEQFLRVQRMETMGSVAGGIAHDLNNALAPVLMGIQLLQRRATAEDDQRMLQLMETNTLRGAGMVKQVLLFSRGQTEDRQPVFLGPLIREIEATIRNSFPPDIQTEVLLPADVWPVLANSTQLHQVLLNLCINARDAMPKGGRITLAADNAELSPEELGELPELRPGRYVLIVVSDTGSGMPEEVRKRIFEPFFTTKGPDKGTGLGLSTSQGIVRQHHGAMRVDSVPNSGTTFEIYLPATTAGVTKSTPVPPLPVEGHGEMVLVVDREQAMRETMAASLTQRGYRVEITGSSIEITAALRREEDPIEFLITSWGLPELPGDRFLALIHNLRPEIPVLITSDDAPLDPLPGSGQVVGVLPRPFRTETLLQRMRDLLERCRHQNPPL